MSSGNTEARVPVEPRNSTNIYIQKGEVNSNVNVNSHILKEIQRESSQSNLINFDLEKSINLEKHSTKRKEKTIAFKVDFDTYSEYKKLSYGQKQFIQESLRAFLSKLLQGEIPNVDTKKMELKIDINTPINIEQKIMLTETCKDVMQKFEKYKKAVMCVKQTLTMSKYIEHKMIDNCVKDLNPYRD